MPFVENLEYLNLNTLRSYPIRDELGATDLTGVFTIPNNFLVEFSLAASNNVSDRFYISRIDNKISSFVVQVSDENAVVVGTFTIPAAGFTEYQSYNMVTSAGLYVTANGRLTIGSLSQMLNSPSGSYFFAITATEFEPRTIVPALQGVNTLTFIDDEGNSNTLSGNVTIVARANLRFTYDSGSNTLTLDAGDGLGLNTSCSSPACITSINGVVPDDSGNVSILGLGCLSMATPTAATIEFTDQCCTPCSGCDDLAQLTSRVTQMESKYIDLKNYYNFLNTQIASYLATVNNNNCICT